MVNKETASRGAVLVQLEQPQFKALERLVVLFTNVSDNLYNIAGFMGAQLTSLRETEAALKAMAPDEAKQLEADREKQGKKGIEVEKKNPFQKLIDFFDNLINILIPFLVGFFIGLKKEFGLIAALVILFRKQIFAVLKELPKVIAFMAGFLKKAIGDAINALSKAFKGLAAKFPSISGRVAQLASRIVNEFRGVLVAYSSQIQKITSFFSKGINTIKAIGSKFGSIDDFFNAVKNIFSKIGQVAGKLTGLGKFFAEGMKSAGKFAQFLGKMGGFLQSFGRFLGPIGAAISIVMSLFTAFKQAFKGFDEQGIFGAIKGFTSGLITGLVGWIGDLGTWLLSKLLGMLGFEELAAKIGEFNFSEFLNTSIQGAFDTVKSFFGNIVTAIPNIFSGFVDNITNAFSKIFSGEDIIGGIVNLLTAVPGMLIDLITAPFIALGDAIKEVFDFDVAALAKKLLISLAPPNTMLGKLIGTGKMQEEVEQSDAQMAKQKAEKKEAELQKQEAKKTEVKKQEVAKQQQAAKITPTVQQPAKGAAAAMAPVASQQPAATPAMTPVAQQPAKGTALAAESQRVAGAGGSQSTSSQNVVAPVTTTNVSQSSSQNVSMPASATPLFGMQASFFGGGSQPSFGF